MSRTLLLLLLLVPLTAGQDDARFRALDVYVDAGDHALAAYQIELPDGAGHSIVGVEGGEGAYAEPPYYDPAALKGGRIVLAAFSTSEELPKGKVRVARIHMMERGDESPDYRARLIVAAAPGGKHIAVTIELRPFGEKR